MKKHLRFLLAFLALFTGSGIANAQTDVTSTYLTNADFSQSTALESDYLYGYGKDGTPYGFQTVDGWTSVVLAGDNSNSNYPNSGMGGGVLSYGSSTQLKGGGKVAPSADPDGNTGNCFGFFAVWGCGGYYYQKVTFPAGKYTLTIPMYSQSGTQANTSHTGFFADGGTSYTVAVNPTVGQWVTQTVSFTLTAETTGQIRIGYKSTGEGSGANPHIFIDKVKIEYTAQVVKDVLSTALAAATKANATLNDSELAAAITTAQAVYDNADATQEEVNAAAETLNAALIKAMAAAGNATFLLDNPGFESCTETTTNAAAGSSAAPVDIEGGWTQVSSGAWSSSAVVAYGGAGQVNGVSAPEADNLGNGGKTLGISVGWGATITYKSANVTLPAGTYTAKINGYNALEGVTQFKSQFGFIPTSGTSTMSTKTSFAYGTWEEDKITFTLDEATEGSFQVGGTAISGGSGNNAKVFFDNITISYQDFLSGAKAAWEEAKAAAEAAVANTDYANITGSELAALNEEIAKAEPTTKEGYEEATTALTTATTAFVNAKASYDAFAAAKAATVPDLAYASAEKKEAVTTAQAAEAATSADDAATKAAAINTAIRAYYESHALAEGVEGAVDYTENISAANADTNTGWTNGIGTNSGQGYTDAAGTTASKYLDGGWSASAGVNIDMTREVSVPAGKYILTVTARGAASLTEYTMSIGGVSVNLPHNGNTGGVFGNGWDDATVEFESDGSALTLEIIAKSEASQQWISLNRFRLVQLESIEVPMADADDYAALAAAISAAEGKVLGFDAEEYAPYNNVAALEALAAAKAIDPEAADGNTKEVVTSATSALTDATWTANTEEVNAVYDGTFANTEANTTSGNINLPGWTKVQGIRLLVKDESVDPGLAYTEGNAAVFSWGGTTLTYGEQTGYTLPLNSGVMYKLSLKITGWRDGDLPNVLTATLDGVSQTKNPEITNRINDTGVNPFKEVNFYFTSTNENPLLTIYANRHFAIADLKLMTAEVTELTLNGTDTEAPAEQYAGTVTTDRTLLAGLNTIVLPFETTKEEIGAATVLAYTGTTTETNGTITLNFSEVETLSANVPYAVMMAADAASYLAFENKEVVPAENLVVEDANFNFVGTYTNLAKGNTTVVDGDFIAGEDAFVKAKGGNRIAAYRAYMKKVSAAADSAKIAFNFNGTVVTGIEAVEILNNLTDGIYNLSGQKLQKVQKGINIVNGKKVLVK